MHFTWYSMSWCHLFHSSYITQNKKTCWKYQSQMSLVGQGSFWVWVQGSTNEIRRYNVTPSLTGWAHTQNDPCREIVLIHMRKRRENMPFIFLCGDNVPFTQCTPFKTSRSDENDRHFADNIFKSIFWHICGAEQNISCFTENKLMKILRNFYYQLFFIDCASNIFQMSNWVLKMKPI